MHHLLKNYVNAKLYSSKYCKCPNCGRELTKKSQNHVFCKNKCKDTFWTKVKGITEWRFGKSRYTKQPQYPGGYEQWKKDLLLAEEEYAEKVIFGEVKMRYLVVNPSGQALGVFHYEEDANIFKSEKEKQDQFLAVGNRPKLYEVKEIPVEDIHEYF